MGDTTGRQNVRFPGGDGEAFGYLRLPESGSGPGVVVIQEWWGLTTHVASIVDRLADAGFVALAPDLYGGPTTHDSAEAAELVKRLPVERAAEDLAGAVDHLVGLPAVSSSTVGAIGFCMGGGFVFALAARGPTWSVPRCRSTGFRATGPSCPVSAPRCRATSASRTGASRSSGSVRSSRSWTSGRSRPWQSCTFTRPVMHSSTTRTSLARTTPSARRRRGRGRSSSSRSTCGSESTH